MINHDAPTIDLTSWGKTELCMPEVGTYTNDRLCIKFLYWDDEMQGWFPHCTLTVNCPEVHLNEGEFLVKDWAENEEIAASLKAKGWITPTGREVSSGFIFPGVFTASGPLKEFLDNQN